MSQANRKDNGLTIGGEPRADLLPPEIKRDVKLKAQRGNLGALIVLVIVIVGAGYGFVTFLAQGAQVELVAANEQTIRILNQQTEFAEVTNLRGQVALATEARLTGSSTEINWEEFIDAAVAALEPGTAIYGVAMNSKTPTIDFAPSTIPSLEPDRMGEINFELISQDPTKFAPTIERFRSLPGFTDLTPTTLIWIEKQSSYGMSVLIHFNSDALANRFVDVVEEESE
jgi:hypothetical protein